MKRVIIDTNALMAISQAKIDIFGEIDKVMTFPYTAAILQGTIKELQQIQDTGSGKDKRAAKLALAILQAKKIAYVSGSPTSVDDALVECSRKGNLVLTQDTALKKRLTRPYLTIRQGNRIMMIK